MKTQRQHPQRRMVQADPVQADPKAIDAQATQGAQESHLPGDQSEAIIEANRSGEWLAVDELRVAALASVAEGRDVIVNLNQVDYLDASALQLLLALGREQKKLQRQFHLSNASPHLRQWFEWAGAVEMLS
jgi:anti-anti-sigma factor